MLIFHGVINYLGKLQDRYSGRYAIASMQAVAVSGRVTLRTSRTLLSGIRPTKYPGKEKIAA